MTKITKSVFSVAGLEARFLPATKTTPKELMPTIDKPIIQYAVEEVAAAGIANLIFLTGRTKPVIEEYFDSNPEFERALSDKGKQDVSGMIRNIVPNGVQSIFLSQPEVLGLGHAVLCAKPAVSNEPVVVVPADEMVCPELPTSQLVDAYKLEPDTILSVTEVALENAQKYGIAEPSADGNVAGLVERPASGDRTLVPDLDRPLRA